jgi:hypothetical protein
MLQQIEEHTKRKVKMKKWPEDQSIHPSYVDLVKPLREILEEGYRIVRKATVKSFEYEGYNIGKNELRYIPSPKDRLTEEYLSKAKDKSVYLVDIILHITFLLGLEQGRRVSNRNFTSIKSLVDSFETYRRTNKDLRYRIDELELYIEAKNSGQSLSEAQLQESVKQGLIERRKNRMQSAQNELALDPTKNNFDLPKQKMKPSFKELKRISKIISDKLTFEQWIEYLSARNWSLDEWTNKCKKENYEPKFTA